MGKYGIGFNDQGRFRVFPAVSTTINKDGLDLVAQGPTGVVAILGPGAGFFPPKKATAVPIGLNTPSRYIAGGDLLSALNFAVRPFAELDRAVSQVYVVPVTPATQASKTLSTGATLRATLFAKVYGFAGHNIKVVLTGAVAPQTLTVKIQTVNQGLLTETFVFSTVQALVDEINARSGIITATFASAGVPDVVAEVALAGATEPAPNPTDWAEAFSALNSFRVNTLSVVSSDSTVWALLHDYCILKRCRGYFGRGLQNWNGLAAQATAMANIRADCALVPGRRMMHATLGAEGQPGYVAAARYAALAAVLEPSVPMTFKRLGFTSLETLLDVDTQVDGVDGLLMAGAAPPVQHPENPGEFIVSRGLSTLASSDNLYDREHSVLAAIDGLQDNLESELRELLGSEGTQLTVQRAIAKTRTVFDIATRPTSAIRILSYRPEAIVGSFADTVLRIDGAVTPIQPVNFINSRLNLERTEIRLSVDVPFA
jgi:hypothetical protein